jgi:hypothetical protein
MQLVFKKGMLTAIMSVRELKIRRNVITGAALTDFPTQNIKRYRV